MRQRRVLKGLAILLGLALVAAACGDDDDSTSSETTEATVAAPRRRLLGLPGHRHRRRRRQVLQPDGVQGRRRTRPTSSASSPAVLESQSEADFAPNIQAFIDQDCDIIVTVGFLLGDATADAAEANPDQNFAIVDYDFFDADDRRRTQLRQRQGADVLHRPGRVPGRLRGGGHDRDRHGRHLRRHQHPDGDHLHEGLPAGHREVQRGQRHRRPARSAGTTPPTTACSPATSRTRPRAGPPPRRCSTRAPTSSCRWPARWAWARSRPSEAGGGSDAKVIWVDTDGCVSVPGRLRPVPHLGHEEHGRRRARRRRSRPAPTATSRAASTPARSRTTAWPSPRSTSSRTQVPEERQGPRSTSCASRSSTARSTTTPEA